MIADRIATAVERFHTLFDLYDHVVVSISGGKDSTCIMETGAIAAREAGRVLDVEFWDEEVIYPETAAYIRRLVDAERSELRIRWYCTPIKESNAWDPSKPHWYPWAPEAEALWVRPMPAEGIQDGKRGYRPLSAGQRLSLQDKLHFVGRAHLPETYCEVIGRRIQESPARRTIAAKLGWLQPAVAKARRFSAIASPIIEWHLADVWSAIRDMNWDWNRAYYRMYQAGLHPGKSRVGPWFGEEPSVDLHLKRKLAPEIWARACLRIPGVADLSRYAGSALMGRGQSRKGGVVTKEAIREAVRRLPPSRRRDTLKSIRTLIKHHLFHRMPIDSDSILRLALRGDSKANRHQLQFGLKVMVDAKAEGHWRIDNPIARQMESMEKIYNDPKRKRKRRAAKAKSSD